MALSEREQQILDDIAANLAVEDPQLTKIASTTHEQLTWRKRKYAIASMIVGVVLILCIALKWWLAPIGAVLVFIGMFKLLRTTNTTFPTTFRARGH